jgi:hypothetical protein
MLTLLNAGCKKRDLFLAGQTDAGCWKPSRLAVLIYTGDSPVKNLLEFDLVKSRGIPYVRAARPFPF